MRAAEETLAGACASKAPSAICSTGMQTRAELYDLLGYSDWERRDQAYFTARAGDESGRP